MIRAAMRPTLGEAPYAGGLLLGAILLVASGYLGAGLESVRQSDFAGFWVGARAVVAGYDPFHAADWPSLAEALGGQRPDTQVFGYPGWVALALVPLALLPLPAAWAVWTFGGLIVAAAAVRLLVRTATPDLPVVHTLAGLTLLASQPARTAVVLGQWAFLLLAALVLAVILIRRRPLAAGIAATVLLAKPQLFLLAYPALTLRAFALGRLQPFAAALVAGGTVLIAGSLIALPGWPAAWLAAVPGRRLFEAPQTTTIPALLNGVVGRPAVVVTAILAVMLLLTALSFRPSTDAGLGIWLVLSLVVAPYQWSYDQLPLLVAIVLVASGIRGISQRRAVLTASAVFALVLLLGTLLGVHAARSGTEVLAALVPALALVGLVIGAWPLRRPIPRPSRAMPSPLASDTSL